MQKLTPEKLFKLREALPTMPDKQKRRVLELMKQYQTQMTQERSEEHTSELQSH